MSYYSAPVNPSTPFEQLHGQDLPKNMHIQMEYVRFHPGTTYCDIFIISSRAGVTAPTTRIR